MTARHAAFLLLWLSLAWPASAHAYLDPATGSIILQMVIGGIAGAGLLLKMYWRRFLGLFGAAKKDDEPAA